MLFFYAVRPLNRALIPEGLITQSYIRCREFNTEARFQEVMEDYRNYNNYTFTPVPASCIAKLFSSRSWEDNDLEYLDEAQK